MGPRYLLLTGKRRGGQVRTTVAVFTTAAEAEAEFARRAKRLAAGGWLELVSIDGQGRITPVSRSGGQPEPQAATRRSAGVGSAPM